MRRLYPALLMLALAQPIAAQDGPLIIDVPNANDGQRSPLFSSEATEQLGEVPAAGGPRVLDLTAPNLTPMQREMAADPMLAPVIIAPAETDGSTPTMPPLTQMRRDGATRIEMLDRCAAFESSLVTILAANEINPQLAHAHRQRFSQFTTAVIEERLAAGLSQEAAERESGDSILEVARQYMTEWENAQTRTGSYFATPLRRLDTLACARLMQGDAPLERPSLSEQLGQDDPEMFGTDE